MTRGRIVLLVVVGLALFWSILSMNSGVQTPKDAKWKVIGGTHPPGMNIKFVEINPDHATDRRQYDSAVDAVCRDSNAVAFVAFFLPGDRVPANQSTRQFFDAGGWSNYPLLAYASCTKSNRGAAEFTEWDCGRAGVDGAPLEALCGPGIKEAFSAILSLAGRAGMAEACGWPKNADEKATLAYIEDIKDVGRQHQFREAFTKMHQSSKKGPDTRSDCSKLRPKIEESAKSARATLRF